jgi:uncharacterized protein (UPF0332 family)
LNTVPGLVKKAHDSLHAARLLASEGLFDCAMNRAYFAMHYVAAAFLLTLRLDARDPEAVVEAFGQRFAFTGVLPPIFHRWLVEAETLCRRADFETETGFTADDIAEQLDRARAFCSLAREELADAPK